MFSMDSSWTGCTAGIGIGIAEAVRLGRRLSVMMVQKAATAWSTLGQRLGWKLKALRYGVLASLTPTF